MLPTCRERHGDDKGRTDGAGRSGNKPGLRLVGQTLQPQVISSSPSLLLFPPLCLIISTHTTRRSFDSTMAPVETEYYDLVSADSDSGRRQARPHCAPVMLTAGMIAGRTDGRE